MQVHAINDIFWLVVVLRVDKSPNLTIDKSQILTIFSYSVEYGGTKGEWATRHIQVKLANVCCHEFPPFIEIMLLSKLFY